MRKKLQDQEDNIKALEESRGLMQLKHQFFMNNQSQNKDQKSVNGIPPAGGPNSALIKFLVDIGASKQQIDQISTKIATMLQKADIKIDDEDQIEPMRKFEIKFLELYEQKTLTLGRSAEDKANIQEI